MGKRIKDIGAYSVDRLRDVRLDFQDPIRYHALYVQKKPSRSRGLLESVVDMAGRVVRSMIA